MPDRKMMRPNELHAAACDAVLEGSQPETSVEWAYIVQYYCANIALEVQPIALQLVCKIKGCPLTETQIDVIHEQVKERLDYLTTLPKMTDSYHYKAYMKGLISAEECNEMLRAAGYMYGVRAEYENGRDVATGFRKA